MLWLDAIEGRYIEEVGAMNICFAYRDGSIATPALSGSILAGITRDSVLTLAPSLGYPVREDRLDIDSVVVDSSEESSGSSSPSVPSGSVPAVETSAAGMASGDYGIDDLAFAARSGQRSPLRFSIAFVFHLQAFSVKISYAETNQTIRQPALVSEFKPPFHVLAFLGNQGKNADVRLVYSR